MSHKALEILKSHWGYDRFRSPQEEVIQSVMDGKDTLALLPTGGGKSICFQVPALMSDGLTLVISPLIALMTDQVNSLREKHISAACLISGMSYRELDLVLDNAVHGKYKLLYLSPERLKTELFKERLKRMNISLLAIDEAHCISQWGFDFRPSYREIKELRHHLPHVPVLALTATATPRVVEDIMEQLQFRSKKLIQKSFMRSNLSYEVCHTEKKWSLSLTELRKTTGSAIVYLRSRRHCAEIAKWLIQNNLSATYYHAGLDVHERHLRQERWIKNEVKIMVCTNAFGMGVDKPDVRLVIHLDLPDSLEAYFQEAGRAGRDGKPSRSLILVGPSDQEGLRKRYLESFPDLKFIKRVYQAIANHLQLAVGSGESQSYSFDLNAFSRAYELSGLRCHHALLIMEREGLFVSSDNIGQSSRVKLLVNRTALYDFQLRNPPLDSFIKTLTRSYGGLETEYIPISEYVIGQRTNCPVKKVKEILAHLHKQGIIDYIPSDGSAKLTYLHPRMKAEALSISDDNLRHRYEERKRRIESVLFYLEQSDTCRSILLLRYFGEESRIKCGQCDFCRKEASSALSSKRFALIRAQLLKVLSDKPGSSVSSITNSLPYEEDQLLEVIDFMMDEGQLKQSADRLEIRDKS